MILRGLCGYPSLLPTFLVSKLDFRNSFARQLSRKMAL